MPGCVEHYLIRVMREHEDFIPELDFVLEEEGKIIGNVMYTKARLVDEAGEEKEVLTLKAGLYRSGLPENRLWKKVVGALF